MITKICNYCLESLLFNVSHMSLKLFLVRFKSFWQRLVSFKVFSFSSFKAFTSEQTSLCLTRSSLFSLMMFLWDSRVLHILTDFLLWFPHIQLLSNQFVFQDDFLCFWVECLDLEVQWRDGQAQHALQHWTYAEGLGDGAEKYGRTWKVLTESASEYLLFGLVD